MIAAVAVAFALAAAVDTSAAADAEKRAFVAVDDKRWCDAAALFEDAFDADPNVAYLLNAAKAAQSAADLDLARTLAARAASIAPARAKEVGALLVKLGDKRSAATCPARPPPAAPTTLLVPEAPAATTTPSVPATGTPGTPATTTPSAPATTGTMATPATTTTATMTTTATATTTPSVPATTATPATPATPAAATSGEGAASPLFVAGAITAGAGALALAGASVWGGALELSLRDTRVDGETKSEALQQAVPVAALGLAAIAAGVVGAVLMGVGG